MSKRKRGAGSARALSNTIVPVLVTVGLAAGGAATGMNQLGSPAEAANPCSPCNPCAAANPCNPCNPCAANPCNPCGGGAQRYSTKCEVPRLVAAAKANPCNPCNPCAVNPCNPCNPCAAANPCNPCNPCGAAPAVELTPEEAVAAYECLRTEMLAAYVKSGDPNAKNYAGWAKFNARPYVSETHGARYVNNYANETGAAYGKFEQAGKMPVGTVLAKDSFVADPTGRLSVGPLFMMEKMKEGFNEVSGDWRYTLIGPNGVVMGITGGKNSKTVEFCAGCHSAAEDTDHLFFMPDDVRM